CRRRGSGRCRWQTCLRAIVCACVINHLLAPLVDPSRAGPSLGYTVREGTAHAACHRALTRITACPRGTSNGLSRRGQERSGMRIRRVGCRAAYVQTLPDACRTDCTRAAELGRRPALAALTGATVQDRFALAEAVRDRRPALKATLVTQRRGGR